MKHGVHLQNQSIALKKYQKLFKIAQNNKTDPRRWSFEAGLTPEPKSVSRKPKPEKRFEAKNRPETARKLLMFYLKHNYPNPGAVDFDMN